MKNSKKGISLIVLVITIIVIIILAAAVLLSMGSNNPVDNATKATFQSDSAEVKSSIALFMGNYLAKSEGVSPFEKTGTITIGTNRATALESVTAETTPENQLGWKDLGITQPSTIETATYDVASGKLTCTPKNKTLATYEN